MAVVAVPLASAAAAAVADDTREPLSSDFRLWRMLFMVILLLQAL